MEDENLEHYGVGGGNRHRHHHPLHPHHHHHPHQYHHHHPHHHQFSDNNDMLENPPPSVITTMAANRRPNFNQYTNPPSRKYPPPAPGGGTATSNRPQPLLYSMAQRIHPGLISSTVLHPPQEPPHDPEPPPDHPHSYYVDPASRIISSGTRINNPSRIITNPSPLLTTYADVKHAVNVGDPLTLPTTTLTTISATITDDGTASTSTTTDNTNTGGSRSSDICAPLVRTHKVDAATNCTEDERPIPLAEPPPPPPPIAVYLHNKTAIILEIDDLSTVTSDCVCQAIVNCDEVGVVNRCHALQLFALWAVCPLLELQLLPPQRPYAIFTNWSGLLAKYCSPTAEIQYQAQAQSDILDVRLYLQRNVFFPLGAEVGIREPTVLELLYEEARTNILSGRYPCEISHCIVLGAIQIRLECGAYDAKTHTIRFLRNIYERYLPRWVVHMCRCCGTTDCSTPTSGGGGGGGAAYLPPILRRWLPHYSTKSSLEVRLLEQYRRIPSTATDRKLIRKYLEFCWKLPYYGAAFFHAQIERPPDPAPSLYQKLCGTTAAAPDLAVLIAINAKGIFVIDKYNSMVLLGLKYTEVLWECGSTGTETGLPCIFLQFRVVENGHSVYKILQIFTKQAELINNLLTEFYRLQMVLMRTSTTTGTAPTTTPHHHQHTPIEGIESGGAASAKDNTVFQLSNKLDKLSLATFDGTGRCVDAMGSWTFRQQP